MSTDDAFTVVCEHMAGMLAQLPGRFGRELDAAEPMTKRWCAVAEHASQSVVLHPKREGRPMPRDLSRPVRSVYVLDFEPPEKPLRKRHCREASFCD